jgi:hypothetical protein
MNGDALSRMGAPGHVHLTVVLIVHPACRNVEWARHSDKMGEEKHKLTENK